MTGRTTALVVGAAGFLGRHVARVLADSGRYVCGLGHGAWPQTEWTAFGLNEWRVCDITLRNLTIHGGEPDEIYHCAGSGSVALSLKHPREDFERNAIATIDVLEYARLLPPGRRVIFPSTAAVYGKVEQMPITTATDTRPISPYGVHKLIGETLCRSYGQNFGLNVAIVRYFSIYGGGLRKQLLWDACNKLREGETVFFGTGEETRDWIHVTDAARLMLLAAAAASPGAPTFNGGCGKSVTIKSIIERLALLLGLNEAIHFSGADRKGDPQHYEADATQALHLGWRPETALDDGLADYVRWFRSDPSIVRGTPRVLD